MYALKELVDKTFSEMLDADYSYKTVYGANWYIWNRLIKKHGPNEIFKEKMIYEYCREYFGRDIYSIDLSKLRKCERRYILAFNNLLRASRNIPFDKNRFHHHRDYILSERSKKLLDGYLDQCIKDGNARKTLENKKMRIRNFIIDADFDSLTKESTVRYLEKRKNEIGEIAYTIDTRLIRRFLIYCYERGEISKEIVAVWPDKMSSISDKHIPSVYTVEELTALLRSAREFTYEDNHLRNYAILCLLVYSGIRARDVVDLKFSNIDWRNNVISIVQHKTKRKHIIPLIPEIGNPIIDYVKNERNSSSEYVFTKEDGGKMITQAVTTAINIYFANAPFDLKGRHYGPHSLRSSMATNLINRSTPVFSVANVLGHSSTKCVHIYAKVDLISLRKCVLEVPYRA